MENNILDKPSEINFKTKRLKLIPIWIKIFCWIFFVTALASPFVLLIPIIYDGPISLAFLGFSSTNPYDLQGILIISIFMLFGIGSYGILYRKDWGVNLSLAFGILGLLLVIINAIINLFNPIPLELIAQIPFIIKLYKIRKLWKDGIGD